jgi:hypothetical protein
MLMKPANTTEPVAMSPGLRVALFVTAAGTVGIGLLPDFFIRAVNWSLSLPDTNSLASLIGR